MGFPVKPYELGLSRSLGPHSVLGLSAVGRAIKAVKVDREAVKSRRNLDTFKSGLLESESDLLGELQRVVMRS